MGTIVPANQFNPAALGADGLYISIVNPPSYIRGVPTDVIGFVGTASWGPVNTAVHMGSAQDGATNFGPISAASVTDPHDLATDVALAFAQASSQASLEGFAVRVTDGTDTPATGTLPGAASHVAKVATLTGTVTAGDVLSLTATGGYTGSPQTVSVTATALDTLATLATRLAAAVNANLTLAAANFFASSAGAVVSLFVPSSTSTTWTEAVAAGNAETATISIMTATETVTIGGTPTISDTVALTFTNSGVSGLPITKTYTVRTGDTVALIAAGLTQLINGDPTLSAGFITATVSGAVITVREPQLIGNSTVITDSVGGSSTETVTFGNGGDLSGGVGAANDILNIVVHNAGLPGGVQTATHTVVAGDNEVIVATALAASITANTHNAALGIAAVAVGRVVQITWPNSAGPTTFSESVSPGSETITLAGGASETITLTTGAASPNGLLLTTLYTGILGNQVLASVQTGSQTGSFTVSLTPPASIGAVSEVFPNIPGANFWASLASAINNGLSGVRGPSRLVSASLANAAVGAPAIGTITLAGGTDGRIGVTTAILVGSDNAPRTGMYALHNVQPAIGIAWICGNIDPTANPALLAFAQTEGFSALAAFPTGTTTAQAQALVAAAGLHDPAFIYLKDWVYWFDSINNLVRLSSPAAFIGGMWATYGPAQSPGNKPVNLVLGTDRLPPNQPGQPYSLSELAQLNNAGVMIITNPIPSGSQWGTPSGRCTSLDPATQPAEYWRMTSYIARSFNAVMGQYVDQLQSQQPNDPLRRAIKLALNDFGTTLVGLNQIDAFVAVCTFSAAPTAKPGLGINTPASIAQHFLYALFQATYLSSVWYFILSLQGGTTVVTVQNGNAQQQA